MYKNWIKYDRKIFEIPSLLSCKQGNPAENGVGKIRNICYFEFSHSGFPCSQDKRVGISKKFLSFFTLFLNFFWNSHPFILWTWKSRVGKFKISTLKYFKAKTMLGFHFDLYWMIQWYVHYWIQSFHWHHFHSDLPDVQYCYLDSFQIHLRHQKNRYKIDSAKKLFGNL